MASVEKQVVRSADLGVVMRAVSSVYCPHETKVAPARGAAASFEVIRAGAQPIVTLSYATPIVVETDFSGLMLMQTCVQGSAEMFQGGVRAKCYRDQTVPLSPGVISKLRFDASFSQRSVRIDIARLERLCASRIGAALDRPLRFEFRTFAEPLEKAWGQAVDLLAGYERNGLVLSDSATAHLDEFLLTLLLEKHPHNYSDALSGNTRGLPPRLIREAEELMRNGGADLTASQIAARLKVSLRSLEVGFKEVRRMTPTQMLRDIRLERVRGELQTPRSNTTVTSAALAQGFFHLPRFSAYYKNQYGELPVQTLRRVSSQTS